MKTEKEKMLAGEMYNPADPVLLKEREEARRKQKWSIKIVLVSNANM
ncbi:Maltose acetyltransferase [Mesobacillus persicus]|uniref:Maltose acetyltransferase n=1 Tax=Mesobacillus persicus TaxID=930146 RepID=A0A1H7WNL2_9BACI|nr:Maltose acetyltransferase [Mesobacillus persicus]